MAEQRELLCHFFMCCICIIEKKVVTLQRKFLTNTTMKTKFLFSFLFVSIISMGQTSSTHVQTLVNSVSSEITLDTEQINQLTIAAEQYVLAIQAANEEHSIDDAALVQAKGAAWQTYTMQVRNILTEDQYQTLQQKQMEHRIALLNQLKEGQQ